LKRPAHDPHHLLPVRKARGRGPGFHSLARRTGQAHPRQHRQARMGRLAGAPDHADQREPAVAPRPAAPRLSRGADGEVPVRRRRRAAGRLRPARGPGLSPRGRRGRTAPGARWTSRDTAGESSPVGTLAAARPRATSFASPTSAGRPTRRTYTSQDLKPSARHHRAPTGKLLPRPAGAYFLAAGAPGAPIRT